MVVQRDDAYRRNYQTFDLEPSEVVNQSWTASQGMLVLTNQRLLYEPMHTPKGLIEPAADALGYGALGKLINGAIDLSGGLKQPWDEQLSAIAAIDPVDGAGIRITLRSGESRELIVAKSLWSPRFSSANGRVRDGLIEVIRAVVADGVPAALQLEARPMAETFVGNWRVTGVPGQGDWGTLILGADGRFNGMFVMFGVAPKGSPVDGVWWLTDPFMALVIQGRVTEPATVGQVVLPFQLILGVDQMSPMTITAEWIDNDDLSVVFTRLQ